MGLGDELMAAGQARKVYEKDPSKRVSICDRWGRPRWHDVWEHNPIIATPAEVNAGEPVHWVKNANHCRPYIEYPFTKDTGWRWTKWRARDFLGEIYLTDHELQIGEHLRAELGPFVYIEPTIKAGTTVNKDWGVSRYQQVVASLPDIQFVRTRHDDMKSPIPLTGPNVRELKDLTFREVVGILKASRGYLGPEGGMHHAAAVTRRPAVVIFGGCHSIQTTGYPTHINLADDGPESPCGRWWPCDHCTAAMANITPAMVTAAVRRMLEEPHESEMSVVSTAYPTRKRDLRNDPAPGVRTVREAHAGDALPGDDPDHRRPHRRRRTAQGT